MIVVCANVTLLGWATQGRELQLHRVGVVLAGVGVKFANEGEELLFIALAQPFAIFGASAERDVADERSGVLLQKPSLGDAVDKVHEHMEAVDLRDPGEHQIEQGAEGLPNSGLSVAKPGKRSSFHTSTATFDRALRGDGKLCYGLK